MSDILNFLNIPNELRPRKSSRSLPSKRRIAYFSRNKIVYPRPKGLGTLHMNRCAPLSNPISNLESIFEPHLEIPSLLRELPREDGGVVDPLQPRTTSSSAAPNQSDCGLGPLHATTSNCSKSETAGRSLDRTGCSADQESSWASSMIPTRSLDLSHSRAEGCTTRVDNLTR
jgi:hypothetical protein